MNKIQGKSEYDKDAGGVKGAEIMWYIIHKIHGKQSK